MIYLFYGDRLKARDAVLKFVDICKKKRENAEYIRILKDGTNKPTNELLLSQGLFEKKHIVLLDEMFDQKDYTVDFLKNTSKYARSEHMFIVFEPSIKQTDVKKLEKAGAIIKEFKGREVVESTQSFKFVETFLSGQKGKSFAMLHKLLKDGEDPDSLRNVLIWQIKNMNLIKMSSSQAASGIKPFPYKKAKELLNKYENPFMELVNIERIVRNGRLNGLNEGEILEYIILSAH